MSDPAPRLYLGRGDDDLCAADYHAQMFPPSSTAPPGSWLRFKMNSTGLNVARSLAAARGRGLAAWVAEHGPVADWPLPHPPTVLWMPHCASAACFGCYWLGRTHGCSVDEAATLARGHALAWPGEHPWPPHGDPLQVWRRDGPSDVPGPAWTS